MIIKIQKTSLMVACLCSLQISAFASGLPESLDMSDFNVVPNTNPNLSSIIKCSDSLQEGVVEYLKKVKSSLRESRMSVNAELNPSCIAVSQKGFMEWTTSFAPPSEAFGSCKSDGHIERSTHPPCLTPEYSELVRLSVALVGKCLGFDGRDLFPLIDQESGFFLNAVNSSGEDAGIAQMTSIGLAEVNDYWPTFEVERIGNPACDALLAIEGVARPDLSKPHVCSSIAIPPSPMQNLLNMGLLLKANRRYVLEYLERDQIFRKMEALGSPSLSQAQKEAITTNFTLMAYNSGAPGVFEAVAKYLEFRQAEQKQNRGSLLTPQDFSVTFNNPMGFSEYLRKQNMSRYLRNLLYKKVEAAEAVGENICARQNFLEVPKL